MNNHHNNHYRNHNNAFKWPYYIHFPNLFQYLNCVHFCLSGSHRIISSLPSLVPFCGYIAHWAQVSWDELTFEFLTRCICVCVRVRFVCMCARRWPRTLLRCCERPDFRYRVTLKSAIASYDLIKHYSLCACAWITFWRREQREILYVLAKERRTHMADPWANEWMAGWMESKWLILIWEQRAR